MCEQGIIDDGKIPALKGKKIGSGSARSVYEMQGKPEFIIKELHNNSISHNNSNQTGWDVWEEIKGSKIASRFGECRCISKSGRYLIMERLGDLNEEEQCLLPEVPTWLTDRQPANFGKASSGSVKVRDYGQVAPCDDRVNAPMWPKISRSEVSLLKDLHSRIPKDWTV